MRPPRAAIALYAIAAFLALAAALAYVSPRFLAETDIPKNFPPRLEGDAAAAYEDVSLIAVLANPSAFDGRKLTIEGYLAFRYEMDGLYLDEGAYEHVLTHNAVWVERPRTWRPAGKPAPSYRRYAAVSGVFDAARGGHMGA